MRIKTARRTATDADRREDGADNRIRTFSRSIFGTFTVESNAEKTYFHTNKTQKTKKDQRNRETVYNAKERQRRESWRTIT